MSCILYIYFFELSSLFLVIHFINTYYKPSISNNNKYRCQNQKHTTFINMDCPDLRAHTSTLCFYPC